MTIKIEMKKPVVFKIMHISSFFMLLCLLSCNKEGSWGTSGKIIPGPDGKVQLSFSVTGLQETTVSGQMGNVARQNSLHHTSTFKNEIIYKATVPLAEGIEADVSLIQVMDSPLALKGNAQQKEASLNQPIQGGVKELKSANVVMPSGIRYRVLIYDDQNNFIGKADATSGSPITVDVNMSKTYKWYAYSYNSTSTEIYNDDNSLQKQINPNAQDLLFASGTIATAQGENKVNILFKHKTASIRVVLNARGMFTPIDFVSASAVNGSQLRSGLFDLTTGTFSNLSDAGTVRVRNWTSQLAGDTVKIGHFYTVDSISAISGFQIKLDTMSLKLDYNNQIRSFYNSVLTFPSTFTPKIGKRYIINVQLKETPFEVNGIQWARNNLYYRASDQGYRFRLISDNVYGTATQGGASGEYFNWPGGSGSSIDTLNDPCHRVYPYGTWRMPTELEFSSLGNATTPQPWYDYSDDPSFYAAWKKNGSSNYYPSNWMKIIFYSLAIPNGTVLDFSRTDAQGRKRYISAFFWTSTISGANPSSATFSKTANSQGVYETSGTDMGLFTTQAIERAYLCNIRCVRRIPSSVSN